MYGRYWQHYQQAMGWQQRHWQAYRKALIAAYGPGHHLSNHPDGYHADTPRRYADWEDRGRAAEKKKKKKRRRGRGPGERGGKKEGGQEDEEEDTDMEEEEEEIECDVSNMEITDELRQYFAQTEKHKEDLKKQQQEEPHVPADRAMHSAWRSDLPPTERPGERRGAEMKKLYGQDAARIQGMETAMQLTFDRNCDRKQPRYWPVIPLKL
ncbi:gem-associated protein 8 [Aplochiton taeniatus]